MEAQFKAGDKLWATALRVNSMVDNFEVLIASKTRKGLREAVEALGCDCNLDAFKRIILTPNAAGQTPAARKETA